MSCTLLATSMPSAGPSTFWAKMTSCRPDLVTCSSTGIRSCTRLIFSEVSSTYGLSKTASIRSRSVTMYGEM